MSYIRSEARLVVWAARLMAIVAEGDRGRVYLAPTPEQEATAHKAKPEWKPDTPLHGKCRVNVSNYGLDNYGDLFTPRQLVALTTFSDLVQEARERVKRDALAAGLPDDGKPLRSGGTGATAYAEAVSVYLGCALSRARELQQLDLSLEHDRGQRRTNLLSPSSPHDLGLCRSQSTSKDERELDWRN